MKVQISETDLEDFKTFLGLFEASKGKEKEKKIVGSCEGCGHITNKGCALKSCYCINSPTRPHFIKKSDLVEASYYVE